MTTAAGWLLDIVENLTGVDVERDLVAPFAGRWGNVHAYGEALTKVAQCVEDVSGDVAAAAADLGANWEGNAADAAGDHLGSIGGILHCRSEALAETGMRYQELATAMRCGRVAAEVVHKAVLDAAIEVAVWAAAGAATSRTPAGTVIGYGMATYKTAYLMQLLEEWARLVAVARADAEKFVGG